MKRKIVEETAKNSLMSAIDQIKKNQIIDTTGVDPNAPQKTEIVDIITFCDGAPYLDLLNKDNGLDLWLPQRIILKCFYMGTIGNEKIELSQKEWEWLYNQEADEELDGVTYSKNIKDVIKKMHKRVSDPNMSYFKELQLVLGRRASKCRWEGDRISTTEGSLTFRELCDRKRSGEKIGICTYDPKTLKRSTTYGIKLENNAVVECITVETKRGIKETSSWNHPYFVWRDEWEEPRFINSIDLKKGDRIAVAEKTELFGKGGIGLNKAALLGHLQGDGGTTNCVGYSTACPIMLNDLKRTINEEFKGYEVKYKSKYDYIIRKDSGRYKQDGGQNNLVKDWLVKEGCFGKKAIEKDVPESIYKGSKEEVSMFLSRLFGCDGYASISSHLSKNHRTPRSQIGYCSSSEKLAYGVRHLLQKYGIHCVMKKIIAKCNGKKFNTWTLTIVRKACLNEFEKEINIFSKENKVREVVEMANRREDTKSEFDSLPKGVWTYIRGTMLKNNFCGSDMVGKHGVGHNDRLRMQYSPNRRKILQYGESINDQFLKNMGTSDVRWDEIVSITSIGGKQTVHMEVEGTHIIGGDIISHNTLMASVITAYEAYKLLVINNGDPHGYYKLPADDEIAIINVALSQNQGGRLFGQIQARLRNSPFFANRIAKETSSEIRLYTDRDLRKKKKVETISVPGSVILLCGHSNPDTLAGYSTVLLLFDEIAFYDETGKVTGKIFYNRLKPSLSKFFKYNAARIVQISSPNTRLGVFYETWEAAKTDDSILSFQLPAWDINPDVPYSLPEFVRDRKSNPEMFATEYGAQWTEKGSFSRYFPEDIIHRCIKMGIGPHKEPQPKCNYYIHVDPAKKGNNYAAVMVAKQRYVNQMGQKRVRCILAGIWIWRPIPGIGVQFNQVDRDMIQICKVFHPIAVTYDDYHSMHSLQLLRSHGIPTQQLSYNRSVKAKLYQNLRDIMSYQPEPELFLYDNGGESSLLIGEMTNLRLKQTPKGFTLMPDKNADIKTDDLVDCIAGACSSANDGIRMSLPEPVTVHMGYR